MTYYQFVNEMELRVRSSVEEGTEVKVHIARKNNGRERRGLLLAKEGLNIAPAIYLEEYYEQFQGGSTIEQIAERILALYKEVRFRKTWEVSCLKSFAKAREKIVYKVINRARNEELLKEVPNRPFMDLAVVCYMLLELSAHGTATMLIRQEHLEMWGVSEKEVFRVAERNVMRLLPAEFRRMKDVIAEMLDLETDEDMGDDYMYVLTNEKRSFGAACIVYEGVADMIGEELGENYYVIPSSIHEVIILPESKAPSRPEIEKMIREVNETQVEEEEVLSDQVYFYDRKEKTLQ